MSGDFAEGQEVVYTFRAGQRAGLAHQRIRCVVVNPSPFPDEHNGEPRIRVRCVDPRDPMNGGEFVPLVAALEPA